MTLLSTSAAPHKIFAKHLTVIGTVTHVIMDPPPQPIHKKSAPDPAVLGLMMYALLALEQMEVEAQS